MKIIGNKILKIDSGELAYSDRNPAVPDNVSFNFVIEDRVRDEDTVAISVRISLNSIEAGITAHLDVETHFLLTIDGDMNDALDEENVKLLTALVLIAVDHGRAIFSDRTKETGHHKNLIPIPGYNDVVEIVEKWAIYNTF